MDIKQFIKGDKTRKSSLINLGLKPLSMVLSLIYTPLLLAYLGDTKYGLWSTILSIISWVNYCDIGVGHGLRNLLTKELAGKRIDDARRSVSTAYIILTAIAGGLLLISMSCVAALDWHKIFNTDIDMRVPIAISFSFICLNFVLALSNFVLYALQLSERIAIRNCIVQLLNIGGLLIIQQYSTGSLVLMAILFGATSMIVYIWNSVQIFSKYPDLRPRIKLFDKKKISLIGNKGIKFFIIQIACLALYTVDNVLITNLFGGEAVTPFNITYKIFNTGYAFLTALCVPYWSKTTEAIEHGDFAWIRKAMVSLKRVAIVFIAGFIALACIFKPLVGLWLGRNLEYPAGLIWVMCIYYCLYTIVTINVQIINGTGEINFQLGLMIFMGAANIPFSIFLAKYCALGVVGIRLATTILMAIAALAFPINLKKIINRLEKTT